MYYPKTTLVAVLATMVASMALGCGEGDPVPKPFPGPGRLMLLKTRVPTGLYQMAAGDTFPRLVHAFPIPELDSAPGGTWQTVVVRSPDQRMALVNGKVVLDLDAGEVLWTAAGYDGHLSSEAAFSPDGKTLATASPSGVHLIDLGTGEERQLFAPLCAPYFRCTDPVCFNIGHPLWLDEETIMFSHSPEYDSTDPEFPSTTRSCHSVGSERAVTVLRTDGTVVQSGGMTSALDHSPVFGLYDDSEDYWQIQPAGGTLINEGPRIDSEQSIRWFRGEDLIRGIVREHHLEANKGQLSLSPDGKSLLIFPGSILDLSEGRVFKLAVSIGSPEGSRPGMETCAWEQSGHNVACLARVFVGPGRGYNEGIDKLVLIPISGDPAVVLSTEDQRGLRAEDWYLVAWLD